MPGPPLARRYTIQPANRPANEDTKRLAQATVRRVWHCGQSIPSERASARVRGTFPVHCGHTRAAKKHLQRKKQDSANGREAEGRGEGSVGWSGAAFGLGFGSVGRSGTDALDEDRFNVHGCERRIARIARDRGNRLHYIEIFALPPDG